MKKIFTLTTLFLLSCFSLLAQQAQIKGKIYNEKTKETIPGVNVVTDDNKGVVSDIDGNYLLKVDPGTVKVSFKFIGFGTIEKTYQLKAGQVLTENINMVEASMMIEGVVVSAGKFEQKLSDVTISMSVLKPEQITNQNINLLNDAINKLPGVDIYDGQPSIRAGSGYSYGAFRRQSRRFHLLH